MDEVFRRRKCSPGPLCLEDTHYHALVRMGPVPLDRILNGLHNSYTNHINAVRKRSGTLFDARPGADFILNDRYMLQLVTYIHQNPVKAGMVESASDYEWSTDGWYRGDEPLREEMKLKSRRFPPHFQGSEPRLVYQQRMGEEVSKPASPEGY